jgi:hypothetical protein
VHSNQRRRRRERTDCSQLEAQPHLSLGELREAVPVGFEDFLRIAVSCENDCSGDDGGGGACLGSYRGAESALERKH